MPEAGGLIQLISAGEQDSYLTSNPQITFFKAGYRRSTNFAMESIEQHFIGNYGFGRTATAIIQRCGDLLARIYISATLPSLESAAAGCRWVPMLASDSSSR